VLTALQRAVLAAPRRDLPWRRTRDPWAVLVSELMLQQTQVARVVPRWEAFVARWPTPAACAADPAADVVRMWAGLGYNRRALNLHRCATAVVERHGGRLPDALGSLVSLPGIGPYTARAVLAFAHGRDVGVVDTNAARVVTRAVAGRTLSGAALQAEADEAVPPGRGWEWNQAVLDLGATVCVARRPRCEGCPLRPMCAWAIAGGPDPWPGATRQSTFEGSDRQGRGRLLDALRAGPVPTGGLAAACGWPHDAARARRVEAALVAEGFAVRDGEGLRLA
jgi:A/G-specific adenine glycosylase